MKIFQHEFILVIFIRLDTVVIIYRILIRLSLRLTTRHGACTLTLKCLYSLSHFDIFIPLQDNNCYFRFITKPKIVSEYDQETHVLSINLR